MYNYKKLLRLFIKDMLRSRGKKQNALLAILIACYAFIMFGVLIMVALMSEQIVDAGKTAHFFTFVMVVDFILTLVLGTIAAVGYLFLGKDSEFFLGLPIKSSTVFFAKLSVVYLTELVISTAIILPIFLLSAITMGLPWLFYLMIPVAILALPIFAMVFISVISMPIVWFISKFKNRGIVMSIVAIILFSGIMFLYFYIFLGNNPAMTGDSPTLDGFLGLMDTTAKIFYPLFMLMNFAIMADYFMMGLGVSMLIAIGIFIGALAIFLLITYLLSRFAYNKISKRLLESKGNQSAKKGDYAASGATKSLIKREWRNIIRNPMVAMNTIGGIIIGPLITVIMVYYTSSTFSNLGDITQEIGIKSSTLVWGNTLMFAMMFGVVLNGSNTSISREGQNFHYMKLLPISFLHQIKTKHLFYTSISTAVNILTLVSVSVVAIINDVFIWWMPILIFINAEVWTYAITALNILFDLKDPLFHWKSVREINKRLKNSVVILIWTFASMFAGGIILGVGIALKNGEAFLAIGITVYILLGIGAAFLFRSILYNNTDRYFRQIEF